MYSLRFSQTLVVLVVVVSCVDVNKGWPRITCKDESSPVPRFLSSFVQYSGCHLDEDRAVWFPVSSLEECAQLCVQVQEASVLNSTGFRFEAGGKCWLLRPGCIANSSAAFNTSSCYLRQEYNHSIECANSAVNYTASISPTSTLQVTVQPTQTSLPNTSDIRPFVVINIAVRLLGVRWEEALTNSSSLAFDHLSRLLKHNIHQLYNNDSTILDVVSFQLRNESRLVRAAFTVLFDGSVRTSQYHVLYRALYRTHAILNVSLEPVTDNLPGKPPTNLTVSTSSDGTAVLSWAHAYSNAEVPTLGYRVVYVHNNTSSVIVVDHKTQHVTLQSLQPSTNYTMLVTSITTRGFGEPAVPVVTMTTATVDISMTVNVTINLDDEIWRKELSNRTHSAFTALRNTLQHNIVLLFVNQSSFQGITIYEFRKSLSASNNTAVQTDLGIFYTGQLDFHPLYDALHKTKRLHNMTISLIRDTVPGKPATNTTWTSASPHTVALDWHSSPSPHCGHIIFYRLNTTNSITVNSSISKVLITGLQGLANYTIWLQSITANGLGLSSDVIVARTLEKILHVNITLFLVNQTWGSDVPLVQNVSLQIEQHVRRLFDGDRQLRDVACTVRNESNNVIADLLVTFGQYVTTEHFSILYNAVYIQRRIGDHRVQIITDTIPGKPPTNLSTTPTGTTSIAVTWSSYQVVLPQRWIVFYSLAGHDNVTVHNAMRTTTVNREANSTLLEGLEKFAYYKVWLVADTIWGLAIPSTKTLVRTLEEVLPVSVTLTLPTEPWHISLLNTSSSYYSNLTHRIQYNIKKLYDNNTHLKENIKLQFRDNDSTTVDIHLVFGQYAKAKDFNILYQAIYRTKRIHQMVVRPVTAQIPGNPPHHVTATANSTTSVLVTWSPVPLNRVLQILRFEILYKQPSASRIMYLSTEPNKTSLLVGNLAKFRSYTFWVSCVTRVGVGSPSLPANATTLEEFVPINIVMRLPTLTWNVNLSLPASEQFNNLSQMIANNIVHLYGSNEPQLKKVICHQFRNGSVIADLTIVYGQHVHMTHFARIYNALYVDGQLFNITAQALTDNIPGKPPVNVTARALSSTSINITWCCADCDSTNDTIAYLVSHRPSQRSDNATHGIVGNVTRHVVLTGLDMFTSYAVWVTSVTIRGNGIASSIVNETTFEDVPSRAPTNTQAHNTTSTSIRVTWAAVPTRYIHGILRGYVVQYKKQLQLSNRWENFTVITNHTNITSLEKFTTYVVRVMAATRVGSGPAGNVTVTTDEDVPSRPPADVQATNTSSVSIEVTWGQVPEGFAHGIILGYHVLYRPSNQSNSSYSMATAHARSNSSELRDLYKYTKYHIRMMAYTVKGNGTESSEIAVYTDQDTPSLPPPSVAVFNTSSTSLNVTWGTIPTYYIHGILRGYRVSYRKANDVNGSYSNVTTVNSSSELTGLDKFTDYLVKVLAYTVKGDGVESVPINITTDEDVPGRSPLHVHGHNTSSTSLFVRWDPVPRGYVHGILRGYKVLYKITNDGLANYTDSVTVNTTRVAWLVDLDKFTIYSVTVLAFTGKGNGPMAINITMTTDEDIPSSPPTNLQARNTSSTSLMVNWNPVPKGRVHGVLRGYRVLYRIADGTSTSFTNLTIEAPTRNLEIKELKKFTVYLVKVLAFTIKGDGPAANNISISTDEDVPSAAPQNITCYNTSSLSLNVTWAGIPAGFVHGVLMGYRVLYSVKRHRSDRSLGHTVMTVNSPSKFHVQLTNMGKYTEYNIRVLGYTRIGDGRESKVLLATTDEDVPSKPPADVRGQNASATSLWIYWEPVPKGFVHGVLLGYRVMYKTTADNIFTVQTMDKHSKGVLLPKLMNYTLYHIKVLAFTRIGDGSQSELIAIKTDENVPGRVPSNVRAIDLASSTRIPVLWSPILKPFVFGILRGYHIKYKLVKLAEFAAQDEQHRVVTVAPNRTNVTLTELQSYAEYEIQVAGFTVKGDGLWDILRTRTCTCHRVLSTNWWVLPPYVQVEGATNESTFNGLVTPVKGIIPPILGAAVKQCCGYCTAGYGNALLDFDKDGYGNKAKKDGLLDVKDRIDGKSLISFPVNGIRGQKTYYGSGGVFQFVSIMDVPGAAFIVADRRSIHREVLDAVLGCWPTVTFVFVVAYMAGVVMWMIDVRHNPEHFARSFIAGTMEGFWWSFITMTTVGYGDRIPKSVPARLFAIMWIWMGIATIAVLTSSITASLMSMVFKSDVKLYGTRIAAIDNSSEYKLGVRRNARLDVGQKYGNISDIYQALKSEHVHAALLDSYATASQEELFSEKWLRVRSVIKTGFESTYGLVLGGDAMKLGRCMRDFMKTEDSHISSIVQANVKQIKASAVPPAIKTSSSLLTSESELFVLTTKILGYSLAILVFLALVWEFGYRRPRHRKRIENENISIDLEGSWPLWAKLPPGQRYHMVTRQIRKDLKEFYENFKRIYNELRKKHAQQIENLREQKKGISYFSVNEWGGGRTATYAVTKDGDINSILDGLDLSMFDGEESEKKKKLGF